MSTILDSLKKSSDKRDDNSKNSMNNFSFSKNGQNKNSKPYVVLLLLILTAAILYFGYQYLYSDEKTQQVSTVTSLLAPSAEPSLAEKDEGNTKENEPSVLEAQTGVQKKDKPNSSDVKQRIKEIKEKRNEQQKALQTLQKPIKKQEIEQETTKLKVPEQRSKQTSEVKLNPTESLGVLIPSNKPTAIVEQKYQLVYQLPFSIRKDIPQLKLNIHVFDKDTENRVAIINGVRFAIDDMIDDVVLVKDIVPEGVLLEFNNRVFLVPK
ncbi:MAG: general secretion pathway protein GspB [Proteobacteria bacterium]|nr:general secretion pathway protein GspB [Pseudomonadota bacterium]